METEEAENKPTRVPDAFKAFDDKGAIMQLTAAMAVKDKNIDISIFLSFSDKSLFLKKEISSAPSSKINPIDEIIHAQTAP